MAGSTALIFNIFARNHTGPVLGSIGASFKKLSAGLAGAAGFAGVTAGIASSVNKAAEFDKTIRLAGTAAGASVSQFKSLSGMALKLGTASQFGAQGAADAMLELAKGGITAARMKAGALAGTLTLASAGGLELGSAATYMTNSLNMFGLKADKASSVAAALAGGANASTASVESLGLALSQVGPGAVNAGLSLQETVAALAAFDNAGIKGSDAGTSLKTMLTRLIPTTGKAAGAMKDLGLKFTDAKGNMIPLTNIAQQLQDKLGGLNDAQRTAALATIFGSDATRAASVLAKEGAAGLEKYIKATSDKAAADKLAKAQTDGAAGSFKKFHSAVDTLQIAFGLHLLPAVTDVTLGLTSLINKVTAGVDPAFKALAPTIALVKGKAVEFGAWFKTVALPVIIGFARRLWTDLQPALRQVGSSFRNDLQPALANLITKFREAWPTIQKVLKVMGGVAEIILTKVVPAIVFLWGKINSLYLRVFAAAFATTWKFIGALISFGTKAYAAGQAIWDFARDVAGAVGRAYSAVKRGIGNAVDTIKSLPGKAKDGIGNLSRTLFNAGLDLIQGFIDGIIEKAKELPGVLKDKVVSVANKFLPSALEIHSPSRLTMRYGRWFVEGFAIGIRDRAQMVQDAIGKMVEAVKAKVDQSRDLAASIRSAFIESINPGGFDGATGSGGFGALLAGLRRQADAATSFAKGIVTLRKQGLNAAMLRQLTEAGPSAIGSVEALIAGGPAGIKQVNSLVSKVNRAGTGLGESEAYARYGVTPDGRGRVSVKVGRYAVDVNLNFASAADELTEAVIKALRKRIKASGGNVQAVLGKG